MKLFGKNDRDSYDGENLIDEIYEERKEREISELERNAEKVEAYEQMQSRLRIRRTLRFLAATLLLTVLTGLVIYVGYELLFNIKEVKIEGDSPYSDEEILEGARISLGDGLFSFSSSAAEARLMAALPYISELHVDRQVPDKVVLTITSEKAVYYTEIYGKIYLLSDSLRLLGEGTAEDTAELIRLRLPGVKAAVTGSTPVFRDGTVSVLLTQVTGYVAKSSLSDRIDQIDLRDLYSLHMVCDGKYLMKFGEYTEIDTKLRIAAAVLEDEMFETSNKAKIDLTNLSETIVVVDNQLDLYK